MYQAVANKETVNYNTLGLNIRSLRCHYYELVILVDNFDKKPDVIGFTENWLAEQL